MKVLALTHAHLDKRGLSPVSCERADSITGTWADRLHWDVDVIHTKDTNWVGIWPNGKGLKFNIINVVAPENLVAKEAQLFSEQIRKFLAEKQFAKLVALVISRTKKRLFDLTAGLGLVSPAYIHTAKKWGAYLSGLSSLNKKKYDFIFACVGYGDEYLLQTALTLSEKLGTPMIVDFRDLWSEHHDPLRFTPRQKELVHKLQKRLLATTLLVSVPQKHMKLLLDQWINIPVYHLAHSAYVGQGWADGQIVDNEFRILYAGKLYAGGPGIVMLLELIKLLSGNASYKPYAFHFFVDEPETLKKLADEYSIADKIVINGWISPPQLWQNLRSAHLLVIIDSSTSENYPLLLTKTFQYAYSGQQLLCLQKYDNPEMEVFLKEHDAGLVTTHIQEAARWIAQLSAKKEIYESLPPLRNIPQREDIAEAFGHKIEELISSH